MICHQFIIKSSSSDYRDISYCRFDKNYYSVRRIAFSTAKSFIEKYEYLGTIGSYVIGYGLFFKTELISVVCFSNPSSAAFLSVRYKISSRENILQITRGATVGYAPKWAASKLIMSAIRDIYQNKQINIFVAYSDPAAGEIGTVYQACGAMYLGLSDPGGGGDYIINGKKYSSRSVVRCFGTRSHHKIIDIDPNYSFYKASPKHRYLIVFDKSELKDNSLIALQKASMPYPKKS